MSLSFIGSASGSLGAGSSASVALPSGSASGDLVFILLAHDSSSATATTSGAYTSLFADTLTGGTVDSKWRGYSRVLDGTGNDNPEITFSASVNGHAWATYAFRGAGTVTVSSATSGNSSAANAPSVSPSVAGVDLANLAATGLSRAGGFGVVSLTSYPSGYPTGQLSESVYDGTNDLLAGGAIKFATDTDDPGSFGTFGNAIWSARSIEVQAVATSIVTGTLARSEAADSVSSAGTLVFIGSAGKTEATDASTALGAMSIPGTVSQSEAADVASSSGGMTFIGAASAEESQDAPTASGIVSVTGTAASAESVDLTAASGVMAIAGAATVSGANDVVAAAGLMAVTGTLATLDVADMSAAVGSAPVWGSSASTDLSDTTSAFGIVNGSMPLSSLSLPLAFGSTQSSVLTMTIAGESLSLAVGTTSYTLNRIWGISPIELVLGMGDAYVGWTPVSFGALAIPTTMGSVILRIGSHFTIGALALSPSLSELAMGVSSSIAPLIINPRFAYPVSRRLIANYVVKLSLESLLADGTLLFPEGIVEGDAFGVMVVAPNGNAFVAKFDAESLAVPAGTTLSAISLAEQGDYIEFRYIGGMVCVTDRFIGV